jgi:hypothetical protein
MSVLFLQARFVIMLIAGMVHEVKLVDKPTFFEELQRPVDGHPIEFRVLFLGKLIETFGIKVETGVVDQVQQDAALAGQTDASLAKRILNAGVGHG